VARDVYEQEVKSSSRGSFNVRSPRLSQIMHACQHIHDACISYATDVKLKYL
jgi:hypothetical protein